MSKDLNDRAREGTLPADPASETVAVVRALHVASPATSPNAADASDAERAICGSLIWAATYAPEATRVTAIADALKADRFGDPRLGAVYASVVELETAGKIADAVAVRSALGRRGERGIDPRELDALVSVAVIPTAGRLTQWAALVEQAWRRRQIVAKGEAIARAARTGTVDDAVAAAGSVAGLAEERESSTVWAAAALDAACKDIFDPKRDRGASTGIRSYDAMIGPLRPGQYTVLGAYTGDGKTAFGLTLAGNVAAAGDGVLYGSTEMPEDQLMLRLACARVGVSASRLIKGDGYAASILAREIAQLGKMPIKFVRSAGMTAADLEQNVKRVKVEMAARGKRLRVVIADYIQEMTWTTPKGTSMTEEQRLRSISSALNDIAKSHEVHVFALAQTHPINNADKGDGKPDIKHLCGAKSIARPAENVVFIHRRLVDGKHVAKGPADIIVRKARWGNRGDVPVLFNGPLMRFEDDPDRPYVEHD